MSSAKVGGQTFQMFLKQSSAKVRLFQIFLKMSSGTVTDICIYALELYITYMFVYVYMYTYIYTYL